jgi:hypothetical protein
MWLFGYASDPGHLFPPEDRKREHDVSNDSDFTDRQSREDRLIAEIDRQFDRAREALQAVERRRVPRNNHD